MKKYLMTGMAAFALCAAFTSCSNNDFEPMTQAEIDKAKYDQAFTEYIGGKISANQDWGFGESVSGTRAIRRALPTAPTFRDTNPITKPTMPSYSNTVPADAKYAKDYQNYKKGDVIYIDTDYSTLNNPQNTEDLTIYVDGNVTYSGSTNQNGNGTTFVVTENSTFTLGTVQNNLTVYLAPNATLNLPENATFQNAHAALYLNSGSQVSATNLSFTNSTKILNAGGTITAAALTLDNYNTLWNEGTISVTNALTCSNTSDVIYNAEGKTITAGRLDIKNNNDLLYNDGTVTTTGEIKIHNSTAEIVNNGTLSGASLNMAAGGKMHNVGTTTITGKTDLTNSNSQWMNDGQYTSGSFDVDNYSKSNYNNCQLTVLGNFHLNRGEFVLNGGASLVCDSFTWEDTSNFYLGSKSLLKVKGDLLTKNGNSGYGFRGYGDDYAVIVADAIKIESNEQFRMSYFGNLYIDTNSHFAQWYKDAPNTQQPCYYYENTVKFSMNQEASPVSIPKSECNPGYDGGGDETYDLRVIAEDLSATSASDFDFNDVVFDVKYGSDAKIKLLAAGGTLKLRIDGNDAFEVHLLFGVDQDYMVNTNASLKGLKGNTRDMQPYVFNLGRAINSPADAKTIKIEVFKNNTWQELTAEKGEPAAKLAVGTDYNWLDERTSIKDEYPLFVSWADGTGFTSKWWATTTEE